MKKGKALKKALGMLVAASLVFSSSSIYQSRNVKAGTNDSTLQIGEINPQLVQYLQNNERPNGLVPSPVKSNNQRPTGLVPLPVKFNNARPKSSLKSSNSPAQYDLRKLDKLTPVKDQGNIGSCWAFGTYASLESWMLKNGFGQQDYSENNLMTHHGFDFPSDKGGNILMSTACFSRWDAPVLEKDDPYPDPPESSNIVVRNNLPVQKHIEDVIIVPDRANDTDNAEIKNAVMQYGALCTSMDYENQFFKSSTNSFYNNNASLRANHAVAIVGWDDSYSRYNFATTPSGDGAFIIRNSWGSSWGDGGYFYVSYYDKFIGKDNAAFIDAKSTNDYDKVHQYDPYGMVDNMGYNNSTAWFANVFQASENENLSAASFYTTQESAQYEIYVETNYDANKFSKLTLVKSGTIDMPGYHTIALDAPVALNAGKNFALAVKLAEANETKPIAIEEYYKGYTSKATASLGQSFMSPDGQTWTDLMQSQPGLKANVCLKAFTKTGTAPVPTAPTITSTNPENGAVNVDNTKPITVAFNENIKAGSAFDNITVVDSSSKAVTADCSINANVLTINAPMTTSNKYTVTIPVNAVVNSSNKTLDAPYTFSFSTIAPAPAKLSVISTNPYDGAEDVPIYSILTITFNSNVKAGTKFKSIKVVDEYGYTVRANCYVSGNSLRIYPALDYGSTYRVIIPTDAITDSSGNTLANDYIFRFATESDWFWWYRY